MRADVIKTIFLLNTIKVKMHSTLCLKRFLPNFSELMMRMGADEYAIQNIREREKEKEFNQRQCDVLQVTTMRKLSNSPSPSKPDRAPMRDGKRVRYKFIASYVPTADATYFYFLQ